MRFRVVRHFPPAASNLARLPLVACLPGLAANVAGSFRKHVSKSQSFHHSRHVFKTDAASAVSQSRSYGTLSPAEDLQLPEIQQAKLQRALRKLDESLVVFRSQTEQQDIKKELQMLHAKIQQLLDTKRLIPVEQLDRFLFVVLPLLSEAVHTLFKIRKSPEMQEKKYQVTYLNARSFLVNLYTDKAYSVEQQQKLKLLIRIFLLPFDFQQKSVNYNKALQVYHRCREACEPNDVLVLLSALCKASQQGVANEILRDLDRDKLDCLLGLERGRNLVWQLMREVDMRWFFSHLKQMDRSEACIGVDEGTTRGTGLIRQEHLKLALLHPQAASQYANAFASDLLSFSPDQIIALFRDNLCADDLDPTIVITASILQGRRQFHPKIAEKLFRFCFNTLAPASMPPSMSAACRHLVHSVHLNAFKPISPEQHQYFLPILIEESVRRGHLLSQMDFSQLTPSQLTNMVQRVLGVCGRSVYSAKRKCRIIRRIALYLLPLGNAQALEECLRFLQRRNRTHRDLIRAFPTDLRTPWMHEALAIGRAPTIWPPPSDLRTPQVIAARFDGLKPFSAIMFWKRQKSPEPVVLLAYARNLARHKRFTLLRRLISQHPEEKPALQHVLLKGYLAKSSLSWRSLKKVQLAMTKIPKQQYTHDSVNILFEATVRYGRMSSESILELLDRVPEAKDGRDWRNRVKPAISICVRQLRRLGDEANQLTLEQRIRKGDKEFVK